MPSTLSQLLAMSASSSSQPPAKRRHVVAELHTAAGGTKVGLARVLKALHSKGLLRGDVGAGSERTVRGVIQQGVEDVARSETPYGKVLTTLQTGAGTSLEVVNPFAYLHYLCEKHSNFFKALCPGSHTHRRLVLYIDEIRPGNPLRPDKCRQTQCVYWTFADLPDQLLVQSDTWFLAATARSTLVDKIPGKVSGFMRCLLNLFFAETGHNMTRGVTLGNSGATAMLTAEFSGFLGDEKALKEIFCLKGATGTKPCVTCLNVVQYLDRPDGTSLVGIDCADTSKFQANTDDGFYEIADRLQRAHRGGATKAALARLEQVLGVNHDPNSIVYDKHLRKIVRPVSHYLRDWMHTIVGHGVAGTEMAMLLQALAADGINHGMVTEYVTAYTLPKTRGTVQADWFAPHRVADDHMRTFASEQLVMVSLLLAFLQDVVQPTGRLPDHIKCFKLLNDILGILTRGPSDAARSAAVLRDLVREHHSYYKVLYPEGIKPKWHHMLHLHEHADFLGKFLSCFATERKHRQVKSAALWSFRYYEHTVLRDLLCRQASILADPSLYEPMFLQNPRTEVSDGHEFNRATVADLPCGAVHAGDIVACRDYSVKEVLCFWSLPPAAAIFAQARPLTATATVTTRLRTSDVEFVAASEIIAPVPWATRRHGAVRVVLPW